ncbi:hypothetical protein [Brevundimonas sp. NIBR11]|uniref:hypothetical protein n=1 Tax=Brevundimonas sp. NIBR11 TaxID=3015999 RepID=UPI0022F0F04D|nr:hypothetical protein [Brevundimonas sp. NIBR11]
MKTLTMAVILCALTACASGNEGVVGTLTLSRDWAERFEASLDLTDVLPTRRRMGGGVPKPVREYARYYRLVEIDGRPVVEAIFGPPIELHPSDWRTSRYTRNGLEDLGPAAQPTEEELRRGHHDIHIDEPFPVIFDGGCSVVTMSIDYETRRVLSASCNGVG